MLEVLSGEPIVLCKLRQQGLQVPERIEALDVNAGDWIADRRVLLKGKHTDTTYVYARSLIVLERLDARFREELLESNMPLGLLWRKHKLETFKEVLTYHVRPAGELGRYFRIPPETLLLTRNCGVRAGGRPVMSIAESLSPSLDDF